MSVAAIDRSNVLSAAHPLLDAACEPETPDAHALLASADLIVLATPVGAILSCLHDVLDAADADAVITDAGSIKRRIIEQAKLHPRAASFVGGHPMSGREIGGFEASRADLFEGARWWIVADGAADGAVARAEAFATAVGAIPARTDAHTHDRAMAHVSHGLQLLESVLVDVADRSGSLSFAGPAFRDATRVAGGATSMWRDIIGNNSEQIAMHVDELITALSRLRDDRGVLDIDAVMQVLERARAIKSRSA